jgi:hypothetical protein
VNADPQVADPAASFSFGETLPGEAILGAYIFDALNAPNAPGNYDVTVTASGSPDAAIEASLELVAGDLNTIIAVETDEGLRALTFADDNRRIATAAKLRLIHGAFAEVAQTVDVYLIPTAAGGAEATSIGNLAGSPTVPDFAFGTTTGYVQVAEDNYVAFITEAGNPGNVLFKSGDLPLTAGGIYTAVARLALNEETQTAGLTVLDDFVQQQ